MGSPWTLWGCSVALNPPSMTDLNAAGVADVASTVGVAGVAGAAGGVGAAGQGFGTACLRAGYLKANSAKAPWNSIRSEHPDHRVGGQSSE